MTSEKHLGLELRVPMARNLIQLVTNVIFEQHNHYLNKNVLVSHWSCQKNDLSTKKISEPHGVVHKLLNNLLKNLW